MFFILSPNYSSPSLVNQIFKVQDPKFKFYVFHGQLILWCLLQLQIEILYSLTFSFASRNISLSPIVCLALTIISGDQQKRKI